MHEFWISKCFFPALKRDRQPSPHTFAILYEEGAKLTYIHDDTKLLSKRFFNCTAEMLWSIKKSLLMRTVRHILIVIFLHCDVSG